MAAVVKRNLAIELRANIRDAELGNEEFAELPNLSSQRLRLGVFGMAFEKLGIKDFHHRPA